LRDMFSPQLTALACHSIPESLDIIPLRWCAAIEGFLPGPCGPCSAITAGCSFSDDEIASVYSSYLLCCLW
jgi:hypothetical protein